MSRVIEQSTNKLLHFGDVSESSTYRGDDDALRAFCCSLMVCWFAVFLLVLFALFNSLGVARNCSSISLVFDFYSSLPCSSLCCVVMSDDEGADTATKRRKTRHVGSDRDTKRSKKLSTSIAVLKRRRRREKNAEEQGNERLTMMRCSCSRSWARSSTTLRHLPQRREA